ncbi:hypothetical protein ACLVWU_18530 [Bdellovibrio sp. HCB290]|uniref:hypothetical protein n=1 Tax=Bdellovibrio sp. HCB290 TaxID=3394356 RepID=UPI0039B46A1C
MKLHLSPIVQIKALVSLVLILFSVTTFASIDENPEEEGYVEVYSPNALVEKEIAQDTLASYKARRETHGIYFGVDYEDYVPVSFVSINDGKTYQELFNGASLPIVSVMMDYKFNFELGSLALGASYGMGSIEDSFSGENRKLEITKYMATIKYSMDNLMNEPYVVPYFGMSAYQMSLNDSSPTGSISETVPMGYAYTLGLLVQLDWLDYDNAKQATFDFGLENTFLDVFMTQYLASGGDEDANMESDPIWGAGLRLEF